MEEPEGVFFLYSGQDKSEIQDNLAITHVRCDSAVTEIPDYLFHGCDNLVTVELNEGLRVIGGGAFWYCTSLKNINIPSTLEEIGDCAFTNCAFSTVELNEGLKRIGNHAFCGCTSLKNINFPSTLEVIEENAFVYCNGIVTAELNEGLKKVEKNDFCYCSSLRNINFPSTVEKIGVGAMYACTSLVNVELNEGLKVIGEKAFNNCTSLTSINFPSTLEEIGGCAFASTTLRLADLPNGLKSIGAKAFAFCTSLRFIFIPPTVKKIENMAFCQCWKLQSVELPEHLEEIGEGAFYGCDELRNVSIPSTVTKLGRIFKGWRGDSKPPPLLSEQFPNDDDDCSLLVNALKTRFDGLPIHELCYHQAHHPTATTLRKLRYSVRSINVSYEKCDIFGMTPFHILALSTKPNIELFRALLKHYTAKFLHKKDADDKRTIDYLMENEAPGSDEIIKILLQAMFGDRIKHLGLEEWRGSATILMENFPQGHDQVGMKQQCLEQIDFTLAKYERLEVLSLLEEFLWSMKIDEAKFTESDLSCGEERANKKAKIHDDSNKQAYRINCGADVVIPNVLLFLGDESATSSSTSEGDDDSSSSSSAGSESEGDY